MSSKAQPSSESQGNITFIYDNQKLAHSKKHSLKEDIQSSQLNLKGRFKKYISQNSNNLFNNKAINKHINTLEVNDCQFNLRKIRQEKQKIVQEMNLSLSESKYFENKAKKHEKLFLIVDRRYKKIEELRFNRKEELGQVEKARQRLRKEIMEQKLKYKHTIDQFKVNLTRSKFQCQKQKDIKANEIRQQRQKNQMIICKEKQQKIEQNKAKHESVKEQEKIASLNVSMVVQRNKMQAQEVKFQKLFRQIVQKQQVQLASSRVREHASNALNRLKVHADVYQTKIREIRKSLGERRLERSFRQHENRGTIKSELNQTAEEFDISLENYRKKRHNRSNTQTVYQN